MKVGDVVQFRYKGNRFVKGDVVFVDNKLVMLTLQTDYIGKNDESYIGELKYFNKKEIKKLLVLEC